VADDRGGPVVRTRPAHGGFPGEVVVRLPVPDADGFVPLGFTWILLDALRRLPEEWLAMTCGATIEEVREARGWTRVRSRTQG